MIRHRTEYQHTYYLRNLDRIKERKKSYFKNNKLYKSRLALSKLLDNMISALLYDVSYNIQNNERLYSIYLLRKVGISGILIFNLWKEVQKTIPIHWENKVPKQIILFLFDIFSTANTSKERINAAKERISKYCKSSRSITGKNSKHRQL